MNEINVINLFSKAIAGDTVSHEKILKESLKRGIIVGSDCCTKAVLDWVKSQPVDYNATFYKEWKDVTDKSRWEIAIDQITNYIFNYGIGESVLPNEGSEQPEWVNFKVLTSISEEEARLKALNMLYKNVARTQETVEQIITIIGQQLPINIEKIQNREAKLIVCENRDLFPQDPAEFVRYLVYLTTGKSLLIKDCLLYTSDAADE